MTGDSSSRYRLVGFQHESPALNATIGTAGGLVLGQLLAHEEAEADCQLTNKCPRMHDPIMKREIWFDRILWSYMPCHWKGWAISIVTIIAGLSAMFGLQSMFDAIGRADLDFWAPFAIFPAIVLFLIVAERHTAPRR